MVTQRTAQHAHGQDHEGDLFEQARPGKHEVHGALSPILAGRQLGLELGAELGEKAEHGPRRGLAQRANGVARDAARDVGQEVDVARAGPRRRPGASTRAPAKPCLRGRACTGRTIRARRSA